MSRHEGVSCDSCLKSNFRGRRYKCLVCFDYDLCSNCFEEGTTTTRHTASHAMQCILTRADHDLYYGGDSSSSHQAGSGGGGADSTMSFACPFCAKLGFTEATLVEHVTSQHAEPAHEVVCPICASLPGGDPNHMTDDFSSHLTLEHRSGPRDLISFLDSPGGGGAGLGGGGGAAGSGAGSVSRPLGVRRVPHASRGVSGTARARRANVHNANPPPSALSALSPSAAAAAAAASRDSVDPIAELLSQLSGVRRSTTTTSSTSSSSQLQQLQMQLQLERQHVQAQRQQAAAAAEQLHRPGGPGSTSAAPRARSGFTFGHPSSSSSSGGGPGGGMLHGGILPGQPMLASHQHASSASASDKLRQSDLDGAEGGGYFLLRQSSSDDSAAEEDDLTKSLPWRKSQFVQDLVLSTMLDDKVKLEQKNREQKSKGKGAAKSKSLARAAAPDHHDQDDEDKEDKKREKPQQP